MQCSSDYPQQSFHHRLPITRRILWLFACADSPVVMCVSREMDPWWTWPAAVAPSCQSRPTAEVRSLASRKLRWSTTLHLGGSESRGGRHQSLPHSWIIRRRPESHQIMTKTGMQGKFAAHMLIRDGREYEAGVCKALELVETLARI